jgi:hypothetical protein
MVLSGIFGLKEDEVTEGWRKMHNEELQSLELQSLYSSSNIIRVIKTNEDETAGQKLCTGKINA